MEKYRECDPQVVEEIREANKVAKEAANRWTGKWDSDYSKGSAVAYKPVSSHEL